MNWRDWLRIVSKYYKVNQKEVLSLNRKSRAKGTFYWILFKAGIDIEQASIEMGKDRTTITKFIKNSGAKKNNKYRDKSAEDYLLNQFV